MGRVVTPEQYAQRVKGGRSMWAALYGIEVVYYARHRGLIKIGKTKNLPTRLNRLRIPWTDVLAYELGDRALERQRHEQFAHLNVRSHELGTEYFEAAPDLLAHIETVMAETVARVQADAS